jgi:hypothetical protein
MKIRRYEVRLQVSSLTLFFALNPGNAIDPGRRISQYTHISRRMRGGTFSSTSQAIAHTADG